MNQMNLSFRNGMNQQYPTYVALHRQRQTALRLPCIWNLDRAPRGLSGLPLRPALWDRKNRLRATLEVSLGAFDNLCLASLTSIPFVSSMRTGRVIPNMPMPEGNPGFLECRV